MYTENIKKPQNTAKHGGVFVVSTETKAGVYIHIGTFEPLSKTFFK